MYFLPLLYKGVILSYTLESKLFHEVDLIGLPQEPILEVLYSNGESGRKEQDLPVVGQKSDYLLHERLELGR